MRDAILLLGFYTVQRLSELFVSRRNERLLIARGAVESGREQYPFMIALHVAWFASLWWLAWDHQPDWRIAAVALALQPVRFWTMLALGERWTTRIYTVPGEGPVQTGPYRFLRHPNYWVVVLEIALIPLAFGLYLHAAIFSVLNAAFLLWRVRVEDRALAAAVASPALANTGQGR